MFYEKMLEHRALKGLMTIAQKHESEILAVELLHWFETWVVEVGSGYEITRHEKAHVEALGQVEIDKQWEYRKARCLLDISKQLGFRDLVREQHQQQPLEQRSWRITVLKG